ncbi:endonuclease, partial [Halorubrum sp. E3]
VDNSYTFSGISVDPGATITLYTGTGDDTEDTVYWGRGSPVWNNGGDTVTVTNATGDRVLAESYA